MNSWRMLGRKIKQSLQQGPAATKEKKDMPQRMDLETALNRKPNTRSREREINSKAIEEMDSENFNNAEQERNVLPK